MGFRNPLTVVTGDMLAADAIDGKTITGATFRTAGSGRRVQIDYADADRIKWISGDGAEIQPGTITVDVQQPAEGGTGRRRGRVRFQPPMLRAPVGDTISITLLSDSVDGTLPGVVDVIAPGGMWLNGRALATQEYVDAKTADTGWVMLGRAVTASGSAWWSTIYRVAVRRIGQAVYLRGGYVTRSSALTIAAGTSQPLTAPMPDWAIPGGELPLSPAITSQGQVLGMTRVMPSGAIEAYVVPGRSLIADEAVYIPGSAWIAQ